MAIPDTNNLQLLQRDQERLSAQRERLRVQAVELRRRQLVLENELSSTGISEAERDYIQQRTQALSNDEDTVGQELGKVELQLSRLKQNLAEVEQFRSRQQQIQQSQRQSRAALQARGISPQEATLRINQLQRAAADYDRRRREREQRYERLKSQAKKTFLLVVIFALWIAAVADILSITDVGWVVSWIIPIVSWFIVRRISAINSSVQQ